MLRKTALYDAHVEAGAKTGEFAGYDMPLYYGEGVIKEHEWVRSHAGIFDVSHMGQVTIKGQGVAEFLERLTPSAFEKKKPGRAQYTVLTNEEGGIVDDLIVTRLDEKEFFAVINAGCKEKDIEWIRSHMPVNLDFYEMEDHALMALQGPWAEQVLHEVLDFNADDLPYMHMAQSRSSYGIPVYISRVGYTGEDGFEVSIPNDSAMDLWNEFSSHSEVKPIGLAARDSLRLEMGYCLYGHDIDEKTTPVEAGLSWVMGKHNTGFIGAEKVLAHKKDGPPRKRVGVKLLDKGIAREGAEFRNGDDEKIGMMTSGGFSPTLKEAIGQGYIDPEFAENGTKIFVNVRGRNIAAEVSAMPFVEAKTKPMKKKAA